MISAGNQLRAANGQAPESPVVTMLKGLFWQVAIWSWLRNRMKTEHALLLLPGAVLGVLLISAFTLGLFGVEIRVDTLGTFYLIATAVFWIAVFAITVTTELASMVLKLFRRVIWWIRRG